jgi:tripartite motif-containing protein 71
MRRDHLNTRRAALSAAGILLPAALAGVLLAPAGEAAAPVPPTVTPVRILGGPGHAGLYGWGAATMSDGSVLIGDYWNFRVQQFEKTGALRRTAVARDGRHQAPFDVAVDLRDDSVYVSDTDGGRNIDKYDKFGAYQFSFGSQSWFKYPSWLEVDSAGRVAVGDSTGNKIVVVDSAGQKLYEFGSSGTAPGQLKDPRGLGIDAQDNLYVADNGNKRIQVFALGATGATLVRSWSTPVGDYRGLTVDKANGWVYLVNAGAGKVEKYDLSGTPLGSFGGFGMAPGRFLDGGRGITVDGDGNVWVGDMPNFRAQKFSPSGQVLLQAPNPAVPPPPGGFAMPGNAALDAAGNLFVIDTYNWRVQKLSPAGTFIRQWGRRGGAVDPNGLQYPRGIAVDKRDGSVVVADTDNSVLKKYTNDGVFQWRSTTTKSFAVDVGPDGTIYAPDFQTHVVRVFGADGSVRPSIGAGALDNPRGIAVDDDGTLWVSNRDSGTVVHLSASGTVLGSFGGLGATDSTLSGAADVEVDGAYVYVADKNANRVKVWTKAGEPVYAFGSGGKALGRMQGPVGLDLTPSGRLYVTEFTFGNERVQEFQIQ